MSTRVVELIFRCSPSFAVCPVAAHPALSSVITATLDSLPADSAAAASPSSDGAADAAAAAELRKQKRAAKQARVQAEAAELRRMKATALAMDEAAVQKAAGRKRAEVAGASSMPPEASSSHQQQHAVEDGTESAPFGNFHSQRKNGIRRMSGRTQQRESERERSLTCSCAVLCSFCWRVSAYYQFNPPKERLQFIPPQLAEFILQIASHREAGASSASAPSAPASFTFLDVGCNEGDLTIGLLQHLLDGINGRADGPPVPNPTLLQPEPASGASTDAAASSFTFAPATPASHARSSTHVHAIGVDIDPLLIERAMGKIEPSLKGVAAAAGDQTDSPAPTLQFAAIDVMEADAIERIRGLALAAQRADTSAVGSSSLASPSSSVRPYQLVCCYSITMWVHLHHGDVGLQRFLSTLASLTTHLILEPQPWQCYKNARERWRRKGKEDPPAMKELTWRTDVELRITNFVQALGFGLRADLGSTKWQRKVLWFERV